MTLLSSNGKTLSGGGTKRILYISRRTKVTARNLIFRDGDSTNATDSQNGGAVLVVGGGAFEAFQCLFMSNRGKNGGAIAALSQPALATDSTISLEANIFYNNNAIDGGALYSVGGQEWPGCVWTSHANMYSSGGHAAGVSTQFSLSDAKAKCIELGDDCQAVTCGPSSCSVRSSSLFSLSTSETSYVASGDCTTSLEWQAAGFACSRCRFENNTAIRHSAIHSPDYLKLTDTHFANNVHSDSSSYEINAPLLNSARPSSCKTESDAIVMVDHCSESTTHNCKPIRNCPVSVPLDLSVCNVVLTGLALPVRRTRDGFSIISTKQFTNGGANL